ncbi:TetR/AcrR family transcriptional regulator [Actinopolymorpha alba]|uniref:TetR/AcrR family transcriptional regulator n=1 Tax=Actinopolymorpha alba TaxID=533267 RepID=UPI00037E7322|nr:TetR/AcrR family transcriptional regulator [Actinopolymorpha alba]
MSPAAARPRRRADAERSIARIVSAARATLSGNPEATIDEIAKAAGVGRMTLYGHFPSRAELVEAAVVDALRDGEATLSAVDLTGDARDALARLLDSSWTLLAESTALLAAAEGTLPAGRIRDLHAGPSARVEDLIRRGQADGTFRTDLPITWLVNVVHYVVHGAADEVHAGRMNGSEVAATLVATIHSILVAPSSGRSRQRRPSNP